METASLFFGGVRRRAKAKARRLPAKGRAYTRGTTLGSSKKRRAAGPAVFELR